ncbi:unnamed protein product [Lampetra fluviatilis]
MDIVFAVDVSNVRDGQSISLSQPQLENKLSEAVAQMKNLNSISCGELITPRLAVAAFRSDGSIVEQSTFQPVIQGLAWNVPRSIKQRGPYVVTDKSIYNLAMKFYNESRHTTIKFYCLLRAADIHLFNTFLYTKFLAGHLDDLNRVFVVRAEPASTPVAIATVLVP